MKTLVSLLENFQVICTVGNAKNAGKTTVLNYLIHQYSTLNIGITSIGLDGEKIDQITFLPKPRIFVWPGMVVATAQNCLQECEAKFDVLEETTIVTALGPIILIKIKEAGNCLVGGPSTIKSMQSIIEKLKMMGCHKILLDGAFSRTTLAQISDATIFCVGASFSSQLEKIASHTIATVKLFQLPKYEGKINLSEQEEVVLIDDENKLSYLKTTTSLDFGKDIISQITANVRFVFVPKAVSASFLQTFIENRHRLHCDLIVTSPMHLMVDEALLNHLFKLKHKIYVLQPINLIALTFNPFSTKGSMVSLSSFRKQLGNQLPLPIYDVLEESKNDE